MAQLYAFYIPHPITSVAPLKMLGLLALSTCTGNSFNLSLDLNMWNEYEMCKILTKVRHWERQ